MVEVASGKEVSVSLPTPEKIGFREIEGDTLPRTELPHTSPHQQIAALSIDRTVDRRTRWEECLNTLNNVILNSNRRKSTVTCLQTHRDIFGQTGEDATNIDAVWSLIGSIVGNYGNSDVVKRALQNANNDSIQESIVKVGDAVVSYFKSNGQELLSEIVSSVLKLSREFYAQEHQGQAYQSAEQRKTIEEVATRAAATKVK